MPIAGRCRHRAAVLVALGAVTAAGCASTRPVRPLARGETVYGASVGGPMVAALGAAFPTPILQAGGAYGLRDRLAAAANLDLTAIAYGTLHVEPGVVWHPVVHDTGLVPSLALAGSLHLLTDFGDLMVAPHAAGIASWAIRNRHAIYTGLDAALAMRTDARVLAGPLLGGQWRRGRYGVGLEVKWLAPYYDTEPLAPSWVSPGNHGYLSILVGVSYHPQEVARP